LPAQRFRSFGVHLEGSFPAVAPFASDVPLPSDPPEGGTGALKLLAILSKDSDDPTLQDDPVLRLVEQIQAGVRVEENFGELFRKFRPLVQSSFSHKGFTTEESRDLTQDVFLRVFKKIDTFRGESRFERWLWEIVTNVYFNKIRSGKTDKRRGFEQSLDAAAGSEAGLSPAMTIPADEPNPEEHILLREQLGSLRTALRELPDQMRRCCLLRYEQDRKYQEIADVMKISIETVKAHLHQARKRLMVQLGGGKDMGKGKEKGS
jgi:RNA polymerase sigma-70 factor (ECF subfamily)